MTASEYITAVVKAVERMEADSDVVAERGGDRVEVSFNDLVTVLGWFGDLYSAMKRAKKD